MDMLKTFLSLFTRLVEAVEEIANNMSEGDYTPSSMDAGAPASGATEAAPKTRKRRTKAEIAAEAAAAAGGNATTLANAAPPPVVGATGSPAGASSTTPMPAASAPAFDPMAAFGAPATPAVPAPAFDPVPAPAFDPVPAPTPAPAADPAMAQYAAQYAAQPVEAQFAALFALFGQHRTVLTVRSAMTDGLAQAGVGLPISNPLDHSQPGDNYKAMTNAQRWAVYSAMWLAAQAAQNAPAM